MIQKSRQKEADGKRNGGKTGTPPTTKPNRARRREDSSRGIRYGDRAPDRNGHALLRLQQRLGNQAVQRVLENRIQPKLQVGRDGDKYEQEADRVARRVMSMRRPQTFPGSEKGAQVDRIQRMCPRCRDRLAAGKPLNCTECEEELQGRGVAQDVQSVGGGLERSIRSPSGGGQPLSRELRSFFEPRFGADFGSVAVHTDSESAGMNEELGARAFTYGNDIFLGRGEFRPRTTEGRELLAHELVHTIQQGGARRVDPPGSDVSPGAATAGGRIGVPVSGSPDGPSMIARQSDAGVPLPAGVPDQPAPAPGTSPPSPAPPQGEPVRNPPEPEPTRAGPPQTTATRSISRDHSACLAQAETWKENCQMRGAVMCGILGGRLGGPGGGGAGGLCGYLYNRTCNSTHETDVAFCDQKRDCLLSGADERKRPSECGGWWDNWSSGGSGDPWPDFGPGDVYEEWPEEQ